LVPAGTGAEEETVDLKDLKYFRAIAECGTFSKAAAHLRIAQPALSRKIQKLEHDLGVQLLQRNARGVTATEAGRVLLGRAQELEQALEDTRREVTSYAEWPTGALRIAVQSPLSQIIVPDLVRAYRTVYPGMVLELTEGFSGDLIDSLLERQLDVAIVDAPSHPHADLKCTPLWVETLQLVCPSGDAIAERIGAGPISWPELAKLPIIMPCRKHAIRRLVDVAFERQRLKFQPAIEANGAMMIFELVKEGLGYTLMPSSGHYPWVVGGQLRTIEVHPAIRRTISLVTRGSLQDGRPVAMFRTLVQNIAPRIAGMQRLGPASLYMGDAAAMPDGHGASLQKVLAPS
jgi:LysR family transcriptional regulator, nitrogen assimilation regulatory protein